MKIPLQLIYMLMIMDIDYGVFQTIKCIGSWDVYKTYMRNINTNQLALLILNRMTKDQQKALLNNLGAEQEVEELPCKSALLKFKQSSISYKELLRLIEDPNVSTNQFFLFNRLQKKMLFVLLFYMLFIMRINLVRNYLLLFLL